MLEFAKAAKRAVRNVIRRGDTDIFPFPIENIIFRDKEDEIIKALQDLNGSFDGRLASDPPFFEESIVPVSYTGFRFGAQIEPLWNVYFLSLVIQLAEQIEQARIPVSENQVFSYRFDTDPDNVDLFSSSSGWSDFMLRSEQLAGENLWVVTCDISDFYARLPHHQLENALKQLPAPGDAQKKIKDFLASFTHTRSHGAPVGGPAARLLSELTLNQIDRLLRQAPVKFVRFADDYHLFCTSKEEAYKALILLSEKLYKNMGLTLQKSKTRLIPSAEFIALSPFADADTPGGDTLQQQSRQLMRLSLRFDPYSPTAAEDFERLQAEISRIDMLPLLRRELTKPRIHSSLARRLVQAITLLEQQDREGAILSLLENPEVLFPVWSSVLIVIKEIFHTLSPDTQLRVQSTINSLIQNKSYVMAPDLNICFAIRILQYSNKPETVELISQIHQSRPSAMVRRDAILAMANLGNWHWLVDEIRNFQRLSPPERSSFVVASYFMSDSGHHWRQHNKKSLTVLEDITRLWTSDKRRSDQQWKIPL